MTTIKKQLSDINFRICNLTPDNYPEKTEYSNLLVVHYGEKVFAVTTKEPKRAIENYRKYLKGARRNPNITVGKDGHCKGMWLFECYNLPCKLRGFLAINRDLPLRVSLVATYVNYNNSRSAWMKRYAEKVWCEWFNVYKNANYIFQEL